MHHGGLYVLLQHPTCVDDATLPGRIILCQIDKGSGTEYIVWYESFRKDQEVLLPGNRYQGFYTKSLAEATAEFSRRLKREEGYHNSGTPWTEHQPIIMEIHVEDGCVVDVHNMHPDYGYEIVDHD